MKIAKKAVLLLCIITKHAYTSRLLEETNHRRLIAISDVINQDSGQAHTFFDGTVVLPGPDSEILRNALHDGNTPIFVTKSVFHTCYNFCIFVHCLINKGYEYVEKKYGTQVLKAGNHSGSSAKTLYALVHFLVKQHAHAQTYVNKLLDENKLKGRALIENLALYLQNQKLGFNDFNQLITTLGALPIVAELATIIVEYHKAFSSENWSVSTTSNGNYLLFPKGYPQDDFNTKQLYAVKVKEGQVSVPSSSDLATLIAYEGLLFVSDLEKLINGIPFAQRKPLDFFMVGHGGLPMKSNQISAGLLINDFQRLITTLGKGKTHSFFYITCHAGGTTTKQVWFSKNKNPKHATAHATYNAPFITIISPSTELPFKIRSPFWAEACATSYTDPLMQPWFLIKNMPTYIAMPQLKTFFSLIPFSTTKALEESLYKPLSIAYNHERSTIISQAALVKLPGTEWFKPQFLLEKVFEITKTKAAKASAEKTSLEQPKSKKIITIASPTVYAPVIIHQTPELRIVPLIATDSSYQYANNHTTTYLGKLVIKDSTYNTHDEILKQLSISNIGPCTVIPSRKKDKENIDFEKDFVIEKVLGPDNTLLAKLFTVTSIGTFFINTHNQLIFFTQEGTKKQPTAQQEALFNDIQNSVDSMLEQEKKPTKLTATLSQSVRHKAAAMKKIELVLADKLERIRKGKKGKWR